MTTFHDQPPQSRRAARQSERADGADSQAGFTETQGVAPQQYSAPEGDMWDTTSRRAAQLPPVSLTEEAPQGRRAATPTPSLPEPLNYSTQSRPAVPSYDGPSFRSRSSSGPQPVPFDPSAQPPTQAIPTSEQPSYRVRDFSPEGRSSPGESLWSEPPAPTAPVSAASDLNYQTEARFRAAAAAAPLAPISEIPASVARINTLWVEPEAAAVRERPSVPASSEFPLDQTYTRRELRAMQQAEEAASLQSQRPAVTPSATEVFPLIEPQIGPPPTLAPTVVAPVPSVSLPVPSPLATSPRAPETPVVASAPVSEPATSEPAVPAPAISAPAAPVASSPFESLFTPSAASRPAPGTQVPVEVAPVPEASPGASAPWTPPTGHWSTQLDVEEGDTETVSRQISSGSSTTSALVLPSEPSGTDIRGPLTSTGEIMLTGSIDLPRNLGATGQSDRFDDGGIDDLFDLSDAEVISTDSSPVRAIRAVSTHTVGHGVTHTQKPKGTRALTALLIAATSMAVVVAGLLIAAFAFNVFG
jgi:hypothetical protein